MMCNRVLTGLMFFQLTTAGQLALKGAVKRSVGIFPLLCATVWFCLVYNRTNQPLMRFIALKSIKREERGSGEATVPDDDSFIDGTAIWRGDTDRRNGSSEDQPPKEQTLGFTNPALVMP